MLEKYVGDHTHGYEETNDYQIWCCKLLYLFIVSERQQGNKMPENIACHWSICLLFPNLSCSCVAPFLWFVNDTGDRRFKSFSLKIKSRKKTSYFECAFLTFLLLATQVTPPLIIPKMVHSKMGRNVHLLLSLLSQSILMCLSTRDRECFIIHCIIIGL